MPLDRQCPFLSFTWYLIIENPKLAVFMKQKFKIFQKYSYLIGRKKMLSYVSVLIIITFCCHIYIYYSQ